MSQLSKQINQFFSVATKKEAEELIDKMLMDEHLKKVMRMFYLENKSIGFIADMTGFSRNKINSDLDKIRKKIFKAMDTRDI